MEIKINHMDVNVTINTDKEEIIIKDNLNSDKLFNMVYKSILNSINIDCSGYTVVRKSNS